MDGEKEEEEGERDDPGMEPFLMSPGSGCKLLPSSLHHSWPHAPLKASLFNRTKQSLG